MSWTLGYGLGGLFSTTGDLARWNRALDSGVLGSEETLERSFSPFVLEGGEEGRYAFGWGVGTVAGRRAVRHSGDVSGYRAHVLKLPEEG